MKRFNIDPQIKSARNGSRDQSIEIMSIQDKSSLCSEKLTLKMKKKIIL